MSVKVASLVPGFDPRLRRHSGIWKWEMRKSHHLQETGTETVFYLHFEISFSGELIISKYLSRSNRI